MLPGPEVKVALCLSISRVSRLLPHAPCDHASSLQIRVTGLEHRPSIYRAPGTLCATEKALNRGLVFTEHQGHLVPLTRCRPSNSATPGMWGFWSQITRDTLCN